jgi:hypothetical protein
MSYFFVQVNCYAQEVINLLTALKSSWVFSHMKSKANVSDLLCPHHHSEWSTLTMEWEQVLKT